MSRARPGSMNRAAYPHIGPRLLAPNNYRRKNASTASVFPSLLSTAANRSVLAPRSREPQRPLAAPFYFRLLHLPSKKFLSACKEQATAQPDNGQRLLQPILSYEPTLILDEIAVQHILMPLMVLPSVPPKAASQSFPLVLGNWPAMRGSRRHAASVARANALNSASTM